MTVDRPLSDNHFGLSIIIAAVTTYPYSMSTSFSEYYKGRELT